MVDGDEQRNRPEMTIEDAREAIVGRLVWKAVDEAFMSGSIDLSDFPGISEHDWADIVVAARGYAAIGSPTEARFRAAYAVLAAQADRVS